MKANQQITIKKTEIETRRKEWTRTAKKYGWNKKGKLPLQLFIDRQGNIKDSVAYKGLKKDIFVNEKGTRIIEVKVE